MRKIFLFALILRLIIAPLVYHSDVLDQLNWAKDIEKNGLTGFYVRDIPDAGPPNYPPLYFLTISANNSVYLAIRSVIWFINTQVSFFPSNVYLWFESDLGRIYFNKLLPILCDLGIGYVIYLIVKGIKDKTAAIKAGVLCLFLPPSWYISSVWGQTDSVFLLPLLTSLYLLFIKKNIFWPLILFTISFLIKPSAIIIFPIILLSIINKANIIVLAKSLAVSSIIFVTVHLPFGLSLKPASILHFYIYNVREISGYISSNAFNFWGIVFGFGPVKDNIIWNGMPVYYWGILITGIVCFYLITRFIQTKDTYMKLLTSALFCYSTFLFLSRMHERYFFLTYILIILIGSLYKKISWFIYISALIFFINLYHYWWVPGGETLKYILSDRFVEILFCLVNLFLFFYLERFREKINRYDRK